MKQFKLKAINLLLCVLTFTAASCKDDEKLSFNANEQESVGLTVSSKGIMIDRNGGTATITVSSEYYWNIYGESKAQTPAIRARHWKLPFPPIRTKGKQHAIPRFM